MGFLPWSANQTVSGNLTVTGTIVNQGLNSITASGSLLAQFGSLDVQSAGQGLKIAEGSNAKQGTYTLAAGTVTVANTSTTASSRILCTSQATGGTVGGHNVSGRTAGTSFTVTSTNNLDTSVGAFEMFEPG